MVIKENFSLLDYNTFHVNATVNKFIELHSIDSASDYFRSNHDSLKNFMILGGGSNILFTKNYEGTILHPRMKGIKTIDDDEDFVYIEAFSGEIWDDVVSYAVENNYGGIENLTLIPGTVGAAPVQNIGAYGSELKDVLESLTALEIKNGGVRKFSNDDCKFGYRDSVFKNEYKGEYLICSVVLKLNKNPKVNLQYGAVKNAVEKLGLSEISISDIRNVINNIRKAKLPDPVELGNAGSFFKNPVINFELFHNLESDFPDLPSFKIDDDNVKIPAAWMIEKSGLKGIRHGQVGTHINQPLVIVNYGGATGKQILDFSNFIRETVKKTFGIDIISEVNIL